MSMNETTIHSQDSRDFQEDSAQMLQSTESNPLTNMLVQTAAVCSKVVSSNCGLFTNYCDQQLQYEVLASDISKTNDVISSFYFNQEEVQEARSNLFDEESVVQSIDSR